ncbi:NADH dehydrogenase [ubiquinone] 1 alpha subcomplex subunit 7-like [Homalodisca vitripennis]|uniref:NADH dehydrogenase [ubiquinone] 1 alpha subcomplex subunit 7 n=1 Tax=Homalodisca liturata TaxID=320908 RepID=A0A1B6JE77_9HEMI|nr:NADH dehydrogenase [ubiquinone] 1 alpha subcomplex subunit 7-like [Homalodisca vitripennis]
MPKVEPRQVSPVIAAIRNFFLGRKHDTPLRYADYYAARTQPPPDLPEGPHHRFSANYYYSHDARREVSPPAVLASYQKQIAAPESKDVAASGGPKTPGKVYHWD